MVGNAVHKMGRKACFLHLRKSMLATRVIANGADKTDIMTEIMGV
jgi:hypothetical protein